MEIDRLEEFVILADCLNFSQAANLLFITQPVLSRHIRDLEENLGVRLFIRDTHRVALTPIGEVLAQEAREVLNAYHKAIRSVELAKKNFSGRLKVGVLGPDARVISYDFTRYLDTTGKLQVEYISSSSMETLLRMLEEDSLDLAFVVDLDSENYKELEIKWVMNEPLYVVVSEEHSLSHRETLTIEELSGESMIAFSSETEPNIASFHKRLFRNHGVDIKIVRTVANLESGLFYAGTGIGFFLIPQNRSNMVGDMMMIPLQNEDTHSTLSLVWKKNRVNSAIKAFVSELSAFYQSFRF